MKISIEIKDNKFIYSYKIGSSDYNSSMEICAESMVMFSDILKLCSTSFQFSQDTRARDAQNKAVIMYEKFMKENIDKD